ncbi:hypothetical protein Q5752_002374 [Cryptotrichosporon argae]
MKLTALVPFLGAALALGADIARAAPLEQFAAAPCHFVCPSSVPDSLFPIPYSFLAQAGGVCQYSGVTGEGWCKYSQVSGTLRDSSGIDCPQQLQESCERAPDSHHRKRAFPRTAARGSTRARRAAAALVGWGA